MNNRFHHFLAERYPIIRSKFPGEGRRKWRLRAIEELWLATEVQAEIALAVQSSQDGSGDDADYENDDDPLDEITECGEVGLLVRTDFTNDEAWSAFLQKLQNAEKEFLGTMMQTEGIADDVEMKEETVDSDSGSDTTPDHIIKIISNSEGSFNGISNLTALRLLNDVDIRLAPVPPLGTKHVIPGSRLVDQNKMQEVYTGKTIWIYDGQSNTDECARLVSQQGSDVYGTATGDSWRARASHIAELQFNMSYYNMKIDFGGLDRWDYAERAKNLNEAETC